MADTGDKLRIKINVYDTELTVNVPREEEEYYRKAAKLITNTVNKYATRFRGVKSDKELMFMAFVEVALLYEKENARNDVMPFNEIISKLTAEIEDALK